MLVLRTPMKKLSSRARVRTVSQRTSSIGSMPVMLSSRAGPRAPCIAPASAPGPVRSLSDAEAREDAVEQRLACGCAGDLPERGGGGEQLRGDQVDRGTRSERSSGVSKGLTAACGGVGLPCRGEMRPREVDPLAVPSGLRNRFPDRLKGRGVEHAP